MATERNSYKFESPMFESIFAALDTVGTPVAWPEVDFVTDRGVLRLFYRLLAGASSKNFRVDLEIQGNRTVLLREVEGMLSFSDKNPGYDLRFEEETTDAVPGCEASKGHHRIVQYTFGGMNFVVRFVTDARTDTPSGASPPSKPFKPGRNSPFVIRAGEIVAQDAMVEIKYAKGERGPNGVTTWQNKGWLNAAAQLLLSGTRHLYTGLHVKGNFNLVEEHDADEQKVLARLPCVAATMRKLAKLLETLREKALACGRNGRALSIVCLSGKLWFYERTSGRSALASEFKPRFNV